MSSVICLREGADLADVLENAPGGALVLLGPGEFRLSRAVTRTKGLSLRGQGFNHTRVLWGGQGTGLRFEGGGRLLVARLLMAYDGEGPGSLLAVEDGAAFFTYCIFRGARDVMFSDQAKGGTALRIATPRLSVVLQCTFEDNDAAGLAVDLDASPRVVGCKFGANGNGVSVLGARGGVYYGNTFMQQSQNGVIVYNEGKPVISDNMFLENDCGVCLFGRGEVDVLDNVFDENGSGLLAFEGARANVERNAYRANRRVGISFGGSGLLAGNKCWDVGEQAIAIWGTGEVRREDNDPEP